LIYFKLIFKEQKYENQFFKTIEKRYIYIYQKVEMKKFLLFFLLIFNLLNAYGQTEKDSIVKKNNPIIYADAFLGLSRSSIEGFGGGLSLSFQNKNDLFTVKFASFIEIREVDLFIIFPVSSSSIVNDEFSLMYGKRYVEDGFAYHFSGGISYNSLRDKDDNLNRDITVNYIGVPIEVGVSWFKSKKDRFRVFYGLIPVGKPTAFGRSFGVKMYANFTKRTCFGIGLSFGLGYHKKYE
jgi:hypothetical protein